MKFTAYLAACAAFLALSGCDDASRVGADLQPDPSCCAYVQDENGMLVKADDADRIEARTTNDERAFEPYAMPAPRGDDYVRGTNWTSDVDAEGRRNDDSRYDFRREGNAGPVRERPLE